jgi:hypothetical protein
VAGIFLKGQLESPDEWHSPGKAFADALLAVWLGPKPPSEELKAGLLGR